MKEDALQERPTMDSELDRLKTVARELWGDSWTIRVTRWADGSQQAFAFRSHGLADPDSDDDLYERERMVLNDESSEYLIRREVYRQEDIVDIVDREEGSIGE